MAGERSEPRRAVASYGTYAEAQGAVDYLSEVGFPVEYVSIAAHGLRVEGRAAGRIGYARTALEGAGSGGCVGAPVGLAFGVFGLVDPLVPGLALALYGLVFGALIGAVLGLVRHAAYGGGECSSIGGIGADRYEVVADEGFAVIAERYLATERWAESRRPPSSTG